MRPRALAALLLPAYAFLYLPLAFMLVFSFNDSRLLTAWTGFSFRWYVALWNNGPLLEAALLSLGIAAMAASLATLTGTALGYVLARGGAFRGRTGFAALLAAPLVLPDVIIGLSLLLLFVASQALIGLPAARGAGTITLAHASFGMAYVAVSVRARLTDAGTELEEAAADLGAPPFAVFRRVTLPLMAPAVASGWLLAFTLSLDDVVVASFVGGPGATTLPMRLFSAAKLGVTPEFYALASIVMLLVALALGGAWLLRRAFPLRPVAARAGVE
jgi:putrescine transport system permease protein